MPCCSGPPRPRRTKPTEETEIALVSMSLAQLETRALELGVLASDVKKAREGPPSGLQKAALVNLVMVKQAQRRKSTGVGGFFASLVGPAGKLSELVFVALVLMHHL